MEISIDILSRPMVTIEVLRHNLQEATRQRDNWIMPPTGHEARRFVEQAVAHHQARIDAITGLIETHAARRAEFDAQQTARKNAARTALAQANPEHTCFKCDGMGRIRGFGHIENGLCFACGGKGIRPLRSRKAA